MSDYDSYKYRKAKESRRRLTRSLFSVGKFMLSSGQESNFKIDCDHLSGNDMDALAVLVAERCEPFSKVVGVPTGGERLAKALWKYQTKSLNDPVLLVDDVYTTGASMEAWRQKVNAEMGAVIFARTDPAPWITPIFLMTPGIHDMARILR